VNRTQQRFLSKSCKTGENELNYYRVRIDITEQIQAHLENLEYSGGNSLNLENSRNSVQPQKNGTSAI